MKLNQLSGLHVEDIVSSIQSVFKELSAIKKSLSIDESGPLGVKEAARYLKVSTQKIYLEVLKDLKNKQRPQIIMMK